jgi:glutamate-1-semialdehyde 2,1-aminomutase
MAAGIETLNQLEDEAIWAQFDRLSQQLEDGVNRIIRSKAVQAVFQRVGTMFTLFFTPGPVTNWSAAAKADRQQYASFFGRMLQNGIYLAPSQFEAGFLCTAHREAELDMTLAAMEQALSQDYR